jgi:hypothetical protein
MLASFTPHPVPSIHRTACDTQAPVRRDHPPHLAMERVPQSVVRGFIQGRKTFFAKGQETLDFYTAQENVFIALKHGVFLMTVIRK